MTLRTRIILVFIIVVSGGFFFLVTWIADDLRPRYLESLEEPLVDTAHILAELIATHLDAQGHPSPDLKDAFTRINARRFEAQVYALRKEAVDIRVYVTDQHGIVVFDSDKGLDEGKDYSRWNDVYLTLRGEYGARSSPDKLSGPEVSIKYVAAPILNEGVITGVVTVGKPARNVNQFIDAAKNKFSVAGIVAAFVALMLAVILYRWVSRPLDRLVHYAEQVKAGERVALPRLGNNEIGMMGAAMAEMRSVLEGKDYAEKYVQTLTHELKSPLAAIRGAAELLEEDMPSAERERFIGNIRTEVLRIQNLIDRMLALAALEKQQTLESTEAVALSTLVRNITQSLDPRLRAKNVTIDNRIDTHLSLEGDRFLLGQAMENLLHNALNFSAHGTTITVNSSDDAEVIVVSIIDEGTGIPEYALERVFERFYSLSPPEDRHRGTGLGLSFVKEVLELHGGVVAIRNNCAGGATATLTIPKARKEPLFRTER